MNLPIDTGRKWDLHKTFRRRPGRLLNVLCTFNLRPVSTSVVGTELIISYIGKEKNSGYWNGIGFQVFLIQISSLTLYWVTVYVNLLSNNLVSVIGS